MHGYGEHSRRYLHMINAFLQAGFAVFADDHIGHGKTGADSGTLGDPHSGGYETYLKDEKSLHDIAVKAYPGLPYFIFGHSWGSMLARGYAALYGEDIKAVMLCGVCSQMKGCDRGMKDPDLKAAYIADPYQPVGDWFGKVFLGMTDRVEHPNGPADWIASDPRIVADHAADPFNCFDTTLELLYDLVALYAFIENTEWAEKVPSRIPFYLIAGDHNTFVERDVTDDMILGVMRRVIRDGREITTKDPRYRLYVHLWCDCSPLRMLILRIKRKIRGYLGAVRRRLRSGSGIKK